MNALDRFTARAKDTETLAAAHVGDIIVLDGVRWRLTKKTNFNAAVERYYWYNAVEDWFLDLLGRILP